MKPKTQKQRAAVWWKRMGKKMARIYREEFLAELAWRAGYRAGREAGPAWFNGPVVYLRDAHAGKGDECWIPCAKGDNGARRFGGMDAL